MGTDSRKRWNLFTNVSAGHDDGGGWYGFIAPNLRLQPSSRVQASIGANYNWGVDAAQWIKNIDADGDGTEDNVYGRLRRNVVNMTGRATYAFSRDMTLEAFLQPFVAVGHYSSIGKLARPSSFEFSPVELADNPDFNRKSLRSTVVLRWEYVRGSTLFFVWNLSTSDRVAAGHLFAHAGSRRCLQRTRLAHLRDQDELLVDALNYSAPKVKSGRPPNWWQ